MVSHIWITQVLLAFAPAVFSTELLPERYLKPQDFNHHPFTDVGIPASLKKAAKLANPYAILSKKRPREGREFPPQNVIFYPTPHPSVISRKHIETNEVGKYDDSYVNIPKNYAFSYIVKDQHSGDDFSHSQAHNGQATRGQYRVKLPDGRTQIVSYTADHKGYRADVQYEDEVVAKPLARPLFQAVPGVPETPAKLPEILPETYQKYPTAVLATHQPSADVVYTVGYKQEQSNYLPSPTVAAPVEYLADNAPLKLLVKPTIAPHYYQPHYVPTTAAPYPQQYVSSTTASHYVPHHVTSTPLHPVGHPTTAAPVVYQHNEYQISSTASPQDAVIVTPRPVYHRAAGKIEAPQHSSGTLYRLL